MSCWLLFLVFFFFKQKTAYEMRISDWSSDVCSSDLERAHPAERAGARAGALQPRPGAVRLRGLARPPGAAAQGRELHAAPAEAVRRVEIGRASCRERVCQYV